MIGPLTRRLLSGAGRHGPLLLMYHCIRPGSGTPRWRWAVALARFVAQLDLLRAQRWRTVTVAELMRTEDWPARTVAITFDDGYADNLAAAEALSARGMVATWFVVSGTIGGAADWEANPYGSLPMLDATALRRMRAQGMEIAAHGHTHCDLTAVTDPARLREEVQGARARLEDLLGEAITGFAYPYGRHAPAVIDAVRSAGYGYACSCRGGWLRRGDDPYTLPRLGVYNADGTARFARKLALGDDDGSLLRTGAYLGTRLRARLGGDR